MKDSQRLRLESGTIRGPLRDIVITASTPFI